MTANEVAMHVLAQLTRFVLRKNLTADEAAALAFQIADAYQRQIKERFDEANFEKEEIAQNKSRIEDALKNLGIKKS